MTRYHQDRRVNELYDVLLHGAEPWGGITVAKRHAPFGHSAVSHRAPNVHLVERVAIRWRHPRPPAIGARWACGGDSVYAVLHHEPPAGYRLCSRCGVRERSVYFAERGGLIKIGYSGTPSVRVAALHARLLASMPGDYAVERQTHARFAPFRIDGEWFSAAPELLAYIASLTDVA